ncbi:hypothetical protein Patl1_18358 [Pistacia atlantica]|uniref:Uncharacterized protein n=1 Tax=Pistacia atlantica TaxID=434234 RepID=A0ACC1BXI5_9ROSI|nr:hypothetical protein Patl1_18358 [Pistacia atlantica]
MAGGVISKFQAKFCREKAVLITVYVEKPRRRRVLSNQHHHHHHHHYLHHINNREVIRGSGKGYNRKAELLRYSQSLRESVRPAASSSSSSSTTLLLPKPTSPKNQQPTTKTVAVLHRKPSYSRTPTCLGNWKLLVPSFIWSLTSPKARKARKKQKHGGSTTTNKMKALMKSLEIQKKKRFIIPKLFSAFRKHR